MVPCTPCWDCAAQVILCPAFTSRIFFKWSVYMCHAQLPHEAGASAFYSLMLIILFCTKLNVTNHSVNHSQVQSGQEHHEHLESWYCLAQGACAWPFGSALQVANHEQDRMRTHSRHLHTFFERRHSTPTWEDICTHPITDFAQVQLTSAAIARRSSLYIHDEHKSIQFYVVLANLQTSSLSCPLTCKHVTGCNCASQA